MGRSQSFFKPFTPEWLIRLSILLVVLPGLSLFVLSITNINAAAGFYGISPNDVQYSCIIFYVAMATFGVLEGRFFKYVAGKEYFLICTVLLMFSCYLCFTIRSLALLLMVRYAQGLLTCGILNITMTLMFNRLHSERARELSYSIVYCILASVIPLSTAVAAPIVDNYSFNVLYKFALFSFVPGATLIFIFMKKIRFDRKKPLYQLDWPSFLLLTVSFAMLGYMAVYGQQYDWFDDLRITMALILFLVLMGMFTLRQLHAKRPYIHVEVVKLRNFIIGIGLLYILYIIRGAFGITTSFMTGILGYDPAHVGTMMIFNIIGIIISVIVSSRMILTKKPIRLIFIYGFSILLTFHIYMWFLFNTQVDGISLVFPIILQGLGVGMLIAPVILFVVSASPAKYGGTGSAIGILIRFSGFCSSIALINYFQLYGQNNHANRFQEQLTALNPVAVERLISFRQILVGKGIAVDHAVKIANGLLSKNITVQTQARFSMDYYFFIIWLIVAVLLILILFPSVNKTIIRVRNKQKPDISY